MKIVLSLCFVILLAGCATALTPVLSPVGESPTPAATRTPVPPTATATVTPMPRLTMEDLKSMSVEDKLKMAPQAESAPKDVVSSFVAGESAKDIAWSGKSLTFWDRVVAYEGTTKSGEKVTLYYDLESGQWAKQYADFDEVSKIPADEVAETMVIGGQLVKNKPAFVREWPDQTEKTLDGKMVFRDEHGNPLAVFDVESGGWLAPEQAGVDFPLEIATEARADGKYPKYDVEKMGIDKFMRLLVASEAQALREGKVVVDPQAVNYGWNRFELEGPGGIPMETKFFGPIYNVNDSPKREPPYKPISIGVMNGSMFGPKYADKEAFLYGIAINNPNPTGDPKKTTIGILHVIDFKGDNEDQKWFLDNLHYAVRGLLFMGKIISVGYDGWYYEPLNNFQGGGDYKDELLRDLVDQGKEAIITPEMEGIIFFKSFN